MQTIPFEDLPSTNTPIDATNLNNMQSYIEQAINSKIGLIALLEASSAAPEQCETGDLYYNTDTALIYEATGTDTWNTVGNAPSYDYLYLDKTNKVIYYFNGTELDVFGAAVVDDLTSSSTVNPPSIDAVNNAINNIDTELNNKIDDLNEIIDTFRPVTLWENSNVYSDFSAKTINLSSTDYDYIELYYIDWQYKNVWASNVLSVKIYKGESTVIPNYFIYNSQAYMGIRRCSISNNGGSVTFSACTTMIDGNRFAANENNSWCVPVRILGYKYYQEVEQNES